MWCGCRAPFTAVGVIDKQRVWWVVAYSKQTAALWTRVRRRSEGKLAEGVVVSFWYRLTEYDANHAHSR